MTPCDTVIVHRRLMTVTGNATAANYSWYVSLTMAWTTNLITSRLDRHLQKQPQSSRRAGLRSFLARVSSDDISKPESYGLTQLAKEKELLQILRIQNYARGYKLQGCISRIYYIIYIYNPGGAIMCNKSSTAALLYRIYNIIKTIYV